MRREGRARYVVRYLLCCISRLVAVAPPIQRDARSYLNFNSSTRTFLLFCIPVEPYHFLSRYS